jgi:hypothetical protein
MSDRRIHLVFKTHLDIGFTDHAEKVRRLYHERFIPQAIETGEHFFREDPAQPKFIWTTGAWLIWDHLESAGRDQARRLEQAIERGLIRWHALPFTTHSELMSPALFRAGLSYSLELDRRFGLATTAAKMTDVPGHTRGIVPLLAEAGVRFLHLGVNTASPVPDVPDVFRWRAPGGEEIVVMYQNSYGATHFPAGFDDGLSFAHTSDNIGPQSVPQTVEATRHIAAEHPGADVAASTLDQFGALLWARRDEFPVIDLEIGDSWIHGVASDPHKTARFLALQRLYDDFAAELLTPPRLAFGRRLALVAEHTWGVDIKSYLRDETAWDRADFDRARATDHRFAYTEQSWAEQRAYIDQAIDQLEPADRERAAVATRIEPATAATPRPPEAAVGIGGWNVAIDPLTGDVASLVAPDGTRIDGRAGRLLGFRHETYDHDDMAAQLQSYIQHRADWAVLDHDKPGLATAHTARSATWTPAFGQLSASGDAILVEASLPQEAADVLGAPARIETTIRVLDPRTVDIGIALRAKPANRMPEAGFLFVTPTNTPDWEFLKLGLWQPAMRVARRGGAQLQAVAAVRTGTVTMTPLDTPLVAPADLPFMRFHETPPPSLAGGIRFNLYNNKWGTNFPMWWEGDVVARYRLTLT